MRRDVVHRYTKERPEDIARLVDALLQRPYVAQIDVERSGFLDPETKQVLYDFTARTTKSMPAGTSRPSTVIDNQDVEKEIRILLLDWNTHGKLTLVRSPNYEDMFWMYEETL